MGLAVKLCGIRREEDAAFLNEFPPDFAGFVFAESKRRIEPAKARRLISQLSPSIRPVGVFVNEKPERVREIALETGLYAVQLHGDENRGYLETLRTLLGSQDIRLWKAVRVREAGSILEAARLGADLLLLDSFQPNAYGGTGKTADWAAVREAGDFGPFFLAGGLTLENVLEAVKATHPVGVDLSGGIETNGAKDREKIRALMTLLRQKGESE